MKNIVLIGMMSAGKSTVAELLATRLKKQLVDMDKLIETREGMTVGEIFATQGESYFRALEFGMAQALSLRSDLVIACGGGLPMQEGAIAALESTGIIVWLNRDPGEIYDSEDLSDRPLAQQGREAFIALAREREETYRRWADVEVTDFTSPVSTAARVKAAVGE